jgi:hypothetical protein
MEAVACKALSAILKFHPKDTIGEILCVHAGMLLSQLAVQLSKLMARKQVQRLPEERWVLDE